MKWIVEEAWTLSTIFQVKKCDKGTIAIILPDVESGYIVQENLMYDL